MTELGFSVVPTRHDLVDFLLLLSLGIYWFMLFLTPVQAFFAECMVRSYLSFARCEVFLLPPPLDPKDRRCLRFSLRRPRLLEAFKKELDQLHSENED
jgi:hypothetical protein